MTPIRTGPRHEGHGVRIQVIRRHGRRKHARHCSASEKNIIVDARGGSVGRDGFLVKRPSHSPRHKTSDLQPNQATTTSQPPTAQPKNNPTLHRQHPKEMMTNPVRSRRKNEHTAPLLEKARPTDESYIGLRGRSSISKGAERRERGNRRNGGGTETTSPPLQERPNSGPSTGRRKRSSDRWQGGIQNFQGWK